MLCLHCHIDKPAFQFYSYSKTKCKQCYIDYSIKRKKTNQSAIDYQKRYYEQWYKKNGRKRPPQYFISNDKWRKEHPIQVRAQLLLRRAVWTGKINKPSVCSSCKREKRLIGHHIDYSKPLSVVWLCHSCHKKEHYLHKT